MWSVCALVVLLKAVFSSVDIMRMSIESMLGQKLLHGHIFTNRVSYSRKRRLNSWMDRASESDGSTGFKVVLLPSIQTI